MSGSPLSGSVSGSGGSPGGPAGGDLSGTYPDPTVVGLRDVPLDESVGEDNGPGCLLVSKPDGAIGMTPAPTIGGQLLSWDDGDEAWDVLEVEEVVSPANVLSALASATGDIDVGGQQVTHAAAPTLDNHLATKSYVDTTAAAAVTESRLRTAAAALTADLAVNGQQITDVGYPSSATHAATKAYADAGDGNTLVDAEAYTDVRTQTQGSKSVAAGGTITLSAGEAACSALRLTGAAGSDTTVEFPATNGRTWLVRNETTDLSRAVYLKAAGGSLGIYLGPGATRRVTVVNGELEDDASGQAILIQITVSLIVGSATNTDTTLCKLPSDLSLRRVTIYVETAAVGGTATLSVGTSSGGTQILLATAAGVAGTAIGDASSQWGASMSANGCATLSAATTLYLRSTSSAALSAGQVVVTIEAVRLKRS